MKVILILSFFIPFTSFSQNIELSYHPNGKKHMKTEFRGSEKCLLHHHIWDENGNEKLINGTGEHSFMHDEKRVIEHFSVKDSIVIKHFDIRLDERDTVYWICESPAKYKDDSEMFYRDVQLNLRRFGDYNKMTKLKKGNKKYVVYVHFIIDQKGVIVESNVSKSVDDYLDQLSLRAVNNLGEWMPAIDDGQKVKFQYILPITY